MEKNVDVSYGVCPECGYIHPPDPSGKCPIMAAKEKPKVNSEPKPEPIIKSNKINIVNSDIDFSDMINKIVEIVDNKIKEKDLKGDDIKKIKQYVIIEMTKAFERYPYTKNQS